MLLRGREDRRCHMLHGAGQCFLDGPDMTLGIVMLLFDFQRIGFGQKWTF